MQIAPDHPDNMRWSRERRLTAKTRWVIKAVTRRGLSSATGLGFQIFKSYKLVSKAIEEIESGKQAK